MADEPTETPAKSTGGIGSKFTKKLGPLPVWAWGLGGAAGIFLLYRWYSAKQTAAAAAAAAAAPATGTSAGAGLSAGTSGTPGSNGYQDNGQLSQLSQQLSTLQQQLGGGTGTAAAQQGTAQQGPTTGGTYSMLQSFQAVQNAVNAGLPVYYQPTAGGPYYQVPAADLTQGSGYNQTFLFNPTQAAPVSGAGGSASPAGSNTAGTAGAPAAIQPPASGFQPALPAQPIA